MKVLILYYTGTGNSARGARILGADLEARGFTVNLHQVKSSSPIPDVTAVTHMIILFPVLAFAMPAQMKAFLKMLPDLKGINATIIANHGMLSTKGGAATGYEGESAIVAGRILRRKGALVERIGAVGYPENITVFGNALGPEVQNSIIHQGDAQILSWSQVIAEGKVQKKKYPWLLRLFRPICGLFTVIGRRHIGKLYGSDKDCTGCGACAQLCPSGTLKMKKGRPIWGYGCDGCLGCYNRCPFGAIQITTSRLVLVLGITILSAVIGFQSGFAWGLLPGIGVALAVYLFGLWSGDLALWFLESRPRLRNFLTHSFTKIFIRYQAPK